MSTQPPEDSYEPYQPTELAANPSTDPPYYEITEQNPYIYDSYMNIPIIPSPPPPPPAKKRNGWMIVSAVLAAILLVGGTVVVMRMMGPGTKPISTTQKTLVVSPTVLPTATFIPTPTAIPSAIPTSGLTAPILYEDFVKAGLPVTSPVTISNSWWLSMGENYYPGQGGIQFTDTRSGAALELAVFNGASAAAEDAQQATSYPTGWAAQYIQVNTCVIFSAEGPINISYYKPTMQQFCV